MFLCFARRFCRTIGKPRQEKRRGFDKAKTFYPCKRRSRMMEKLFNPYKQFLGSFIPNCLMEYEGLTAMAKLCWARLAQYAGMDGRCHPMQETLAREIGISSRQVIRILKELEIKGFIYTKKPT